MQYIIKGRWGAKKGLLESFFTKRHVMGIFFYDRVYLPFCMTLFHSSISICCKVAFLSTSFPRNIVDNFKVFRFTLS